MKTLRASWTNLAGAALAGLLTLAFFPLVFGQEAVERGKGYVPPSPAVRKAVHAAAFARHDNRIERMVKAATPPAKFDCVDMGWAPPVRDQGSCGSCYLVATADQMTCQAIKAGHGKADDTFKISDQFGMDCHNFGGCGGGWGAEVAEYMLKSGFPAERYLDTAGTAISDYPAYEARERTCRLKAGAKLWKLDEWGFCTGDQSDRPATVAEIKASMLAHGVINIAFRATSAYSNAGPTTIVTLSASGADHETTLVGWDDAKQAWKTRGNWGKGLGDGGYVWASFKSTFDGAFWMHMKSVDPPGPIPGVLTITPAVVTLAPGGTQQFVVSPAGNYSWSASGGGITNAGLYTAPTAIGAYTVSVTVAGDPTKFATAAVTVSATPPPPPSGTTIVLSGDLKAGTYQVVPLGFELVPNGTLGKLRDVSEQMKQLEAILNKLKEPESPKVRPTPRIIDELEATAEPPALAPVPPAKVEYFNPDKQSKRDPRTGKIIKN